MKPLRRAVPGGRTPGARRTVALVAVSVVSVLAASTAQARLLVGDDSGHRVSLYNAGTGAFVETLIPMGSGGLQSPDGLAFGPDGKLYVSDPTGVLRYNGQTGAFLDTLIAAGVGGLDDPAGLAFGPDGSLYVSSAHSHSVLRFNGTTGAFVDAFVPAGSGGLQNPHSLAFGPDGNLYVSSSATNSVLRYNGQTGAFIDTFVPVASGGLNDPLGLTFGPDNNLYVSSSTTNSILRYNGKTGAFIGEFVPAGSGGLAQPDGLSFGPDGNLYAASQGSHTILRYSGSTGAFLGTFVTADAGPSTPGALLFVLEAPTNLAISHSPQSSVLLSWTDNSDAETAFAIWRKSETSAWARIGLVRPNSTTFADKTADPNGKYVYRVRAISNTIASAWSNEVSLNSPSAPAAPTDLSGTAVSPTQIRLTWNDHSGNETAFAIWRKSEGAEWRRVGLVPPHSTAFSDTHLTPGITYSYLVRASNNIGTSDWTNGVTLTTGTPPAAPTDLAAKVLSPTQIQLTWTSNSDNETAFAIWRKSGGEEWKRIGLVPPHSTSFTDTHLTPGQTYSYQVRASNNDGTSDWTNGVSLSTGTAPAAPTGLAARVISGTQIQLTWKSNSDNETAFAIWRKNGDGEWKRVGVVPPHSTSFTDSGLTSGATYHYLVRAANNIGTSDWTNEVTATTAP
jgi:fibronectin type 3 domain-containing protein